VWSGSSGAASGDRQLAPAMTPYPCVNSLRSSATAWAAAASMARPFSTSGTHSLNRTSPRRFAILGHPRRWPPPAGSAIRDRRRRQCCDPRPPRAATASYVIGGYAHYLAQLRSSATAWTAAATLLAVQRHRIVVIRCDPLPSRKMAATPAPSRLRTHGCIGCDPRPSRRMAATRRCGTRWRPGAIWL
jgi:hypothetical protein